MTLNYVDCHHWYSLPKVIAMMKSGKMRWEVHRACMRDWTRQTDLVKKPEGYRPI